MNDIIPSLRRDLEFFPINHQGQQFILIRDHLGLVQEGKAIAIPLYQFMIQLDGRGTIRDLQTTMTRQQGGVIVTSDEIRKIIDHLDESFLIDNERFQAARDRIVAKFSALKIRPCSHCGQAYPTQPAELISRLDELLSLGSPKLPDNKNVLALVAPHIDLNVGAKVYASAYGMIKDLEPTRILIMGVGHKIGDRLFCLTDKDFETPLGLCRNDTAMVSQLKEKGEDLISDNDFAHRSEHSIEFQVIFLQHIFKNHPFTIIPVLCGPIQTTIHQYRRQAYLEKARTFLEALKMIIEDPDQTTLIVAGVDFSHVGLKFGHRLPADQLDGRSKRHDRSLLNHLAARDADAFWQESAGVNDEYNVCGFSALACLLEILPPSKGEILDYQIWHEQPTRSAVSFAAVVFK